MWTSLIFKMMAIVTLLFYLPSVRSHLSATYNMKTTSGAAYCAVVGVNSYGTNFEVIGYDSNNHLPPLVFFHSVAPES